MHAISPYMVTVVDGKSKMQDLWNLNGSSLHAYLKQHYFPGIAGRQQVVQKPTSDESGKVYIFKKLYTGTPTSIAGVYDSGLFGFETNIVDTVSVSSVPVFTRSKDQSDMRPFHFSFYLPSSKNVADNLRGMLLLSRIDTSGIRQMVMPDLIQSFDRAFPGLKLRIEKIVPSAVVSSLLQASKIRKIRLFQHTLPKDYSQVLGANDVKRFYEFEAVIKPQRGTPFSDVNWFLDAIKNKTPASSIFTIPNSTIDRVKVEVLKGKKVRTSDVGDLDKVSPVMQITKPKLGADGHIEPQFWLQEADSLADDLFSETGVNLPTWNSTV